MGIFGGQIEKKSNLSGNCHHGNCHRLIAAPFVYDQSIVDFLSLDCELSLTVKLG